MATTTRVFVKSEAEYGCEHLAAVLGKDESTAAQFRESFAKSHAAIEARKKSASAHKASTPKTIFSLRPTYHCLTCSETCDNGGRHAHSEKTGHKFYLESRNCNLFCQGCDDLVYDGGLERLLAMGYPLKASKKRKFSDSSADQVYVRANANKRPCGREGARGIYNLGQSCYMNVILQALLHDPILNTYFLGNGHQGHECLWPRCMACPLADAFADANNTEKNEAFTAVQLMYALWNTSVSLQGYRQQDAHEFYQFLVDRLHATAEGHADGMNEDCPCFFHKAFYGKLRSTVTCDNCGNVTRTEDPIMDLSLDVQTRAKKHALGGQDTPSTPTLHGCLERFTSPERLSAGMYNCSECGGAGQKATKQLRIKKLPAILCMQLKRFGHSEAVSEKLEGRVNFPLSINMLPYTTKPNSQKVPKSKYMYDLSTAVIHKGQLDTGHYYAYCRQGEQWMLFNDDQVTPAGEADVLNADAYLLFYNLRSLTAKVDDHNQSKSQGH
ncbi:hypothetical protein DTO166G4_215 [Paecilomyces variotii]|nr:hypothetical protein DTO166G4_215 [Paecilomyces variotii]KAJ9235896.1 hypothetical protein DTO166G5_4354 [Paecilomyces variotii]KAJ9243412.1 hypothetical protein DTO169E5_2655 [Paecilomyces variotii]KAJ9255960.1 hypothetical protein DTO212C5_9080 [Paecilomyces variotii]KAJ9321905.1 hypothetical protein DTO027B3_7036 [Paecilomyces variotii]